MSSHLDPLNDLSTDGTRSFAADRRLASLAETREKEPLARSTDAPNDTPTPIVPHLPRYTSHRHLGHGGYGHVWLAWDKVLRCDVALKFMLRQADAPPVAVQRFAQEAAILAQLEHPNVVRVFDAGEADGQLYFAMKYVPGGSLHRQWKQVRTSVGRVVELIRKLAGGIAHAHARGVFHRDLKPGNVLLDGDEPLAADFGIAKWDASEVSTQGLAFLGTPNYMAPESLAGGSKGYDARGDVYSLGVILYQLLTDALPHQVTFQPPVSWTRTPETPKPLAEHPAALPGVDGRLEAVVRTALAVAPEARYQTADDFAADLDRWQRGEPVLANPPEQETVALPPPKRRRKWAWVVAAVVVVVLGVGLTLAMLPLLTPKHEPTIAELVNGGRSVVLVDDRGSVRVPLEKVPGSEGGAETQPDGSGLLLTSGSAYFVSFAGAELNPPYELSAEVHHLRDGLGSEAGVGVAHRQHSQQTHALYLNTFRGASLLPGREEAEEANAFAGTQWVNFTDVTGAPVEDLSGGRLTLPIERHPPTVDGSERECRRLVVRVTPDAFVSTHGGNEFPTQSFAQLTERATTKFPRGQRPTPLLGGRFGLFVSNGSALFRNVVLRPLSPEGSTP